MLHGPSPWPVRSRRGRPSLPACPSRRCATPTRALDRDPYDEAALRVVMAAHVAAGRPASALAEYATMRERLAEDLGVNPSPETAALHAAVLAGDTTSPASEPEVEPTRLVGRTAELRRLDTVLRSVP